MSNLGVLLLRRTMRRATGVEEMTDILRLEVLMDFEVNARGSHSGGDGIAAVRWQPLTQSAALTKDRARVTLAALHYGRILAVHRKLREELFHRVSLAARGLADGSPETQFDTWPLHIGDASFNIMPWHMVQPDHLKPKTCASTLKIHDRGRLSVYLKTAFDFEHILAPASALLAISTLAQELADEDRVLLGRVLLAMNDHYGTPDRAVGPGKEAQAFAAAVPMLSPSLAEAREAATEAGRARREAAFQRSERRGWFLGLWGVAVASALAIGIILAKLRWRRYARTR
jgi:hypothetical protein